jgi:ubiquitin-activating enzyme E1
MATTTTTTTGNSYRQSRTLLLVFLMVVAMMSWFPTVSIVDARRLPWLGTQQIPSPSSLGSRIPSSLQLSPSIHRKSSVLSSFLEQLRGGGSENEDEDNDEERYSRQVYTMGARAHGLIRSSVIYVDGPIRSGLLWESIKNLALSGVGKLVLIVDDDDENDGNDENGNYHLSNLDDLGAMYIRGALSELELLSDEQTAETISSTDLVGVLVEFLRRLNPALEVSTISKSELLEFRSNEKTESMIDGGILLCVDRPYTQQKEWNDSCRRHSSSSSPSSSWKFVSVETAGVYGRIFCDFGPKHAIHDSDGETPLVIPLDRVESILVEEDKPKTQTLLLKSVEGERHDVSRDDIVVFQRSDGSTMEEIPCKVTKVRTPEQIEVEIVVDSSENANEVIIDQINAQAVTFSRQKQIEEVSFRSLEDTLREASVIFQGKPSSFSDDIFTPCDLEKSFDETRRKAVFCSFQALDAFVQEHGRMPRSTDTESFFKLAQAAGTSSIGEECKEHCQNFLRTCPAKLVPLQAIFGAIASQECLKAISGLYNPIRQFLLYDCDEVLTAKGQNNDDDEYKTSNNGLSFLLGSETTLRLKNQKLFVVGSGAIGCEILKNLAAMDAGTGNSGSIVVTDMDTIEKSNLSRQLLFRDSDIGKFKSKAAEEAVFRMNPSVRVESHISKVGDEEDPGPFDSKFWYENVDVILNALDNMEARLFMDEQCVANRKALVDAGTLGSKGNVQVVVPYQSESYGSSADPPEQAIPVCTLKNFPYAISHTIQWGRDLFDGLYVRRPNQANKYAQEFLESGIGGMVSKLDEDMGDEAALEAAKELSEDLRMMLGEGDADTDTDSMKRMSVDWAINLGTELFHDVIVKLLEEHPVDKLDEEGELFWSGSRKPPKPLSFSLSRGEKDNDDSTKQEEEINNNTIDFVRSAARLRYETYTGIPSNSRENLGLVSKDSAKEALIDASEKEGEPTPISREGGETKPSKRDAIRERLSLLDSLAKKDSPSASIPTLSSAEFEKDDESNDHITFITAASNLRAICYGIAPVDAMETRLVAGKIVPAMITTTAFVSALSCLELIKLTQGLPLNRHRNAFINLALPFFAFTSPLPAEEYPGVKGETHTLWDKITIKEGKKAARSGGLTLKRFLRRIQKKAYADDPDAVQVSNISIGPIMVYANFLHEDDEDLLNKSIWDVIDNAMQSGEAFDEEFSRDGPTSDGDTKDFVSSVSSASFIDLAVSVEDTETFEEMELPQVRLIRSK